MATGTRAFLRRFSSSAEHRRFRDAKPKNSPDDPRAMCKRYAQTRRAGACSRRYIRIDRYRKEKGSSCQGFRTPLCAEMQCGCGAAAGRKASPKPEGFGGDERSPNSSCQGFRTPLCAGMGCGCGATVGCKAIPKPEGFGGDERSPNSSCQGFRTRFAPGCGADAELRRGAKPVQSPRALEGFESGTMIPKQKSTPNGVLFCFGAPSGIRTRDPLIKSQLLYQLS